MKYWFFKKRDPDISWFMNVYPHITGIRISSPILYPNKTGGPFFHCSSEPR